MAAGCKPVSFQGLLEHRNRHENVPTIFSLMTLINPITIPFGSMRFGFVETSLSKGSRGIFYLTTRTSQEKLSSMKLAWISFAANLTEVGTFFGAPQAQS
jgi:hypothetical protein